MEDQTAIPVIITKGTLIGHVLGEWAGFTYGKLMIELFDGVRMEFRFGKDSQGAIPRIGSLISVEHPSGNLPEISKIELIEDNEVLRSNRRSHYNEPILIMGRSVGVAIFVLTEFALGFVLILIGFTMEGRNLAPIIFGLCGVPHIMIGYFLWYFTGD